MSEDSLKEIVCGRQLGKALTQTVVLGGTSSLIHPVGKTWTERSSHRKYQSFGVGKDGIQCNTHAGDRQDGQCRLHAWHVLYIQGEEVHAIAVRNSGPKLSNLSKKLRNTRPDVGS
jgi:hypothetical protein